MTALPSKKPRIDPLTSIRFVAAILVVFYHIGGVKIPLVASFMSFAPYVITFFFVLSGFVMTFVYYRPGAPFDFKHFWLARISRIYPIYLLSFLLACIHYADVLGKINAPEYFSAVLLLQGWFPRYALSFNFVAWTLSVEIFFYFIFPFAIVLFRRLSLRTSIGFSTLFWIANQTVRQGLQHSGLDLHPNFLAYLPPFHLDSFLLGVVAGIWFLTRKERESPVSQKVNLLFLLISLGVVIIYDRIGFVPQMGSLNGLYAPLFVVIILTLALDRTRLAQWLSQRWLVVLGESSYALYALHGPLLFLFEDGLKWLGVSPSPYLLVFVYLPVTISLSIMAFRRIEWPAQNWLRSHPIQLVAIVLDIALIAAAIGLAFVARLGLPLDGFERSVRFSMRVGVPLIFLALVWSGYYSSLHASRPFRKVVLAVMVPVTIGFLGLAGSVLIAAKAGWIGSFPRTVLPIGFVFTLGMLWISQRLFIHLQAR